MERPLIFNAFVQFAVSHVIHGLWRHPHTSQRDFNNVDVWVDLAKLLERGKFNAIFFADTLAVHSNFRGGQDTYVKEGIWIPTNDPSVLAAVLAHQTEHLGVVFTSSILQAHPFEFARRMATLDHISHGRIGWNVVTNYQRNAFKNFGFDQLVDHDERYRWGQEYLDVVYKLWEHSWEDDAFLVDPILGIVSNPAKVHAIDHVGERYRVSGPHLVTPSPQRAPMLFQAGSSAVGQAFAAQNAEGVFLIAASPAAAEKSIRETRASAISMGRGANDIKFMQGLTFVVGSTEEEAWKKDAEVDELLSIDGQLAMISAVSGIDLGLLDHDTPLTDLVDKVQGVRGVMQTVIDAMPASKVATIRDYATLTSRGTRVTGTPSQIVDALKFWVDVGVDGFNIMYITTPASYVDFIDHVAPLLQKQGTMQRDYAPGTLREKMFPGRGPHLANNHPARASGI